MLNGSPFQVHGSQLGILIDESREKGYSEKTVVSGLGCLKIEKHFRH